MADRVDLKPNLMKKENQRRTFILIFE